jgi:hypothetical protein
MRRNGRDAPIPDLRALTPERGGSTEAVENAFAKLPPSGLASIAQSSGSWL